jgi:hypothetical protein
MLKNFFILSLMMLGSISNSNAYTSEKMYINADDFDCTSDNFRIHIGNNMWIGTDTIHRDENGLYTFESNIIRSTNGNKSEYQKKWKCPYCYMYWPVGTACQNKDCPSKYK